MFDRQLTTVHRPFTSGDRVRWRGRSATVKWVKNLPPDFVKPMAYNIVLDDQRELRGTAYTGTVVSATEVLPERAALRVAETCP